MNEPGSRRSTKREQTLWGKSFVDYAGSVLMKWVSPFLDIGKLHFPASLHIGRASDWGHQMNVRGGNV